MHREDCGPLPVAAAVQGGQAWEVRPKAERLKRPTLTLIGQSINFHYKFVQYKERLSDNKDNPARLLKNLAGASVLCSRTNLIKTNTVIRAANEAKLEVLGFIPISVQLVGHQDKKSIQALYITKQLKSLFLSRTRILELGCLPMSWPYPSH